MSFCPVCKTEHPEGEACRSAPSSAENLGAAATIYDPDSSSVPVDPLIGKTLGHWTVVRRIGEGGMGIVYVAKEPLSGAQVAVKVLRLDEVNRIADSVLRQQCLEEAKERFRREAEVARRLGENQPNIVQILGYGTLDDGRPYFAMEFLYGRSLDARMRQATAPSREDLRRWFEQACDALWVIHDAGVVHRDLKPENIWISEPKTGKSSAKLLDFGISKVKGGPALTAPGMVPGTVLYLAPERLAGNNDDPRSDIYAMGVILYEVFTGRMPFAAETIPHLYSMILHDAPPPLRVKAGLVLSPKLERLIFDCLAKRPEDRPQTALDLKARILEALDEREAEAPSRPRTIAPPPKSSARPAAPVPPPQPSVQLPGPETQADLAPMARARRVRLGLLLGGAAVLVGGAAAWMLANRAPGPTPAISAPKIAPTPTAITAVPAPSMTSTRPDAGVNVAARKPGPRPRPNDRPVVPPLPAALQPEPLPPSLAPALPTATKAKSIPTAPSPPVGTMAAPSEPAPEPVQARREALPSRPGKLSKPSKADHDLITNEQILLGN